MRLKRLIQQILDLEVRGSLDLEITGLCANSKLVAPGNLFIAKKGLNEDGNSFIADALAAGAVAVLTDMADPFVPMTQLVHPDIAQIEGKLAATFYNTPSTKLKVVGITGTNGKTTTSFLIKHLFDKEGLFAGLIGSIEWIIGEHRFSSSMTTPDVIMNHKLLREMNLVGCRSAVMEVSSHGLDQQRVAEIDFDIGLFTNLSPEHLDYHKDMESYRIAKEKLFLSLGEDKWAIFNADEPWQFKTRAQKFTYGIDQDADLTAKNIQLLEMKSRFTVCFKGEEVECRTHLIGKFNVYNLLGAIAVGICSGISLERCCAQLRSFKGVPGRLERVKNHLGVHIFVDFAHKEEALANVLETLNGIKKNKVITVFGCGGERDREKRKKMGAVANRLSDWTIITTDNPRSEDPQTIASEILRGFDTKEKVTVELDRKEAIRKGLELAEEGDILLIAGKGHEKEQIFAHQVIPFDDVEAVLELCKEMGHA